MEGIGALVSRDALLLADDMGLGKTVQAIAALRMLSLAHRMERALVIVPAGLVSQWRREFHRWAPELRLSTVRGAAVDRAWQWSTPAHVYLVSYETFRSDFTANPQSPPRRHLWDLVLLDEAQRIKNRDAQVSRKCKQLGRRRTWALTGTPLENCVDDLASVVEFVAPLREAEKPRRLTPGLELFDLHRALQLRRKKEDVLPQLPPKLVSELVLPLDGVQRTRYERAEREGVVQLRAMGEAVRVENVLELILRLKQLCNFCPVTGKSAKIEDVVDRLRKLRTRDHRALVFSQFTDSTFGVEAIASRLAEFRPLVYTGKMTYREREDAIREFKESTRHRVLVLSLRAGGQGLNLQDASYVVHFDRWWNPAVEHQAEDRSHRMGQQYPVHVYSYICEDTIEERIAEVLRAKQRLFDDLVDGVSLDLRSMLTASELFGLFGLTPPAKARGCTSSHPG